jgi:hypothetical protein
MGAACGTCGGVGFVGTRTLEQIRVQSQQGERLEVRERFEPTGPCPDCTANFEAYKKTPEAKIAYVDVAAGGKKIPRTNELTFGEYVPPRPPGKKETVQSIDGGPISEGEGVDARAAGFSEQEIEQSAR